MNLFNLILSAASPDPKQMAELEQVEGLHHLPRPSCLQALLPPHLLLRGGLGLLPKLVVLNHHWLLDPFENLMTAMDK